MTPHNNRGGVTIPDVTHIAVIMKRLGKHVSAETNSRNNRRVVFPVRSVPSVYKQNKKTFQSFEFRDASLPGYELGNGGVVIELRNFLEMARN
jgi:hypothetical protein